jgi:hypothetical protein
MSTPGSLGDAGARRRRRTRRVSRFLLIVFGITALAHVPVALAVTEAARRAALPRPALIGIGWALAGFGGFVLRARAGVPDRKRHPLIVWLLDIPFFIHWCAAVFSLIPSVFAALVLPALEGLRGTPMQLPIAAFMWIYATGLAVCGYGVLVRRRWVRVIELDVPVPGMDRRLDGLRIAHLSDLHIGALTPRAWGLSWARLANDRRPDIAVVTGDMVTSGAEFHEDIAHVVGELRAPLGVFASMGNHDYFGEGDRLAGDLSERGVRVLRNEGTVVRRGGALLWVAAIDDTWTRRDDIASAMRDRPADALAILLAHDPERFEQAARAGADVVLSGHTHGGQIAVPFLSRALNLAFVYQYRVGLYRLGQAVLHVHPGLGTTGPPIRLGVAPEVTLLILRAA